MAPGDRRMQTIDGWIRTNQQLAWRAGATPIAEVAPGETFRVRIPDSSSLQLSERSTRDDLRRLDLARVDAAVGPIAVRTARPGDALGVTIRRIVPAGWGWSAVFREFGFLKGRFDDDLVIWRLTDRYARPLRGFLRPVRIPLSPMLGVIGVAPASGEFPMIPPQPFGGNMDSRLHAAGTTVFLPVFQPGALLGVGDPHAAQGDGEVCGTGIETCAEATLRVDLIRNGAPAAPRARLRRLPTRAGPFLVTTGIAPDLTDAATQATEEMIRLLESRGVTSKEAYLLLSIVGDLRISEVVDDPNRLVSMVFPESALPGRARARGGARP